MYRITIEEFSEDQQVWEKEYRQVFKELDVRLLVSMLNMKAAYILGSDQTADILKGVHVAAGNCCVQKEGEYETSETTGA